MGLLLLAWVVPVRADVVFSDEFEKPSSAFTWDRDQSGKSFVGTIPAAAFEGNAGLRVSAGANYNVRKSLMWPSGSRFLSSGAYIAFQFRINRDTAQTALTGEPYVGLLDVVVISAGKTFGNPTLMVRGSGETKSLQLIMRRQKNDNPLVLRDRAAGAVSDNTWHRACVFLQIRDSVQTDSLFLDGKCIGQASIKLIDFPGFIQDLFLCPQLFTNLNVASVDVDNFIVTDSRLAGQPEKPVIVQPCLFACTRTQYPEFVVAPVLASQHVQGVEIEVQSNGVLYADSLFDLSKPLIFTRPFTPGRQYMFQARFLFGTGSSSPWAKGGPFVVAADSTPLPGPRNSGLTMGFQPSAQGENIFSSGDTLAVRFGFPVESHVPSYIDFDIRICNLRPEFPGRFGSFDPSGNLIFSIGPGGVVYYKSEQATDLWKEFFNSQEDSAVFPATMIVPNSCMFAQAGGMAGISFFVTKEMEPGMWEINACLVNDTAGTIEYFPSLFFNVKKPMRGPIVVFIGIGILILVALFLVFRARQRRMASPEVLPPAWKKIVDDTEVFLKEHCANSELDSEAIAAAMSLSAGRLTGMYQQAKGKSPVQHLREIRIAKACDLLKTTVKSVAEIGYEVGFKDPVIFQRNFSKMMGQTPGQYRTK